MAAPDYSIKSANKKIVDLLEAAGDDGLHTDFIVEKLGYKATNEVAPRLRDLRGRGEIKLIGKSKDLWRRVSKDSVVAHFEGDKPKIYLPGDPKYTSYKNSLQEFCQKKGLSVPSYQVRPEQDGYMGIVTYAPDKRARTTMICNEKDAEQQAALEALKQIGYLNDKGLISASTILKRKSSDTASPLLPSKQIKVMNKESITFKSKLNDYCLKHRLLVPKYETVSMNDGFSSKVVVDNKTFQGSGSSKRKNAEQSAAQAALNSLVGIPLSASGEAMTIGEDDVAEMIAEAREASHSQPGQFKSRLQELCIKKGKGTPTYETIETPGPTFQSTVTIQGMPHTGPFSTRKKDAEGKAAELALKALESMIQ